MTSKWRQVTPDEQPHGLSRLFVQYCFGSSDYQIQLTDLTTLWSESVERRELIRRAWDAGTSIDPSEGPSQMQLLMNNIKASLDSQSGSSMTIDVGDNDYERLNLKTLTPLPGGLKPLIWPIHLHRCSQTTLTTSLIYPCLSEVLSMNDQVQSLLQVLVEKDNAIAKLMDRLQSDPVGISATLLGSSKSKAGVTRNLTGRAVKSFGGLVPFDEVKWRTQHFRSLLHKQDLLSNVSLALGLIGSNLPPSHPIDELSITGEGYPRPQIPIGKLTSHDELSPVTPSPEVGRATRESPQVDNNGANEQENEGSTTEDTEDEEPEQEKSKTSPFSTRLRTGTKYRHSSSSTIDGEERSPTTPRDRSDKAKALVTGGPTLTNGLSLRNQAATQLPTKLGDDAGKTVHETAKSPRSKLGKIGGRRAVDSVAIVPSNEDSNNAKKGASGESPTTSAIEAPITERRAPRETSKDRANRKREQLRQNLQAGSNNSSRKKRKF